MSGKSIPSSLRFTGAADGLPALGYPATPDPETGQPSLLALPQRLPHDPRYDGTGVTVAFVDIGFFAHPDLIQPVRRIVGTVDLTGVVAETDCAFDQGNLTSWHGMMCSVVGAGNGFLSQGFYRSLAPGCNLVLVRIGRGGSVREPDIYRGLQWLLRNHARYNVRIASLSIGGDRPTPSVQSLLDQLVAQLTEAGVLVVCAAGNRPMPRIVPPASAVQALTVGGLDDRNTPNPAAWQLYPSSYGPTADGLAKPDLLAPAQWVPSPFLPDSDVAREAVALGDVMAASDSELRQVLRKHLREIKLDELIVTRPVERIRVALRMRQNAHKWVNSYYQYVDGTSVAAPIIASVAAQMLQANPHLTPSELKHLLCQTAMPLFGVAPMRQGAGVVQPHAAVAAAMRTK